jgi:DNA polymerase-3 subunit chi
MKANFHILENIGKQQALLYACRLVETAYANQQTIYIQTNSTTESTQIDELLWTYRDDSFVPHDIYIQNNANPASILIGHDAPPPTITNTLLNLSSKMPASPNQFENIIEIVFDDPSIQQSARDRYRQYRDIGFELNTHKLKAADL